MRKPGPPREIPPPLELECLKTLWRLGAGNVSDVRKALPPSRSLAYTTVMTVLDRLVRKGGLERQKVGRSFVYRPLVSRHTLRGAAVRQLVDGFFDGSEDELIAYLRNERRSPAPDGPVEQTDARLDPALL